MKLTDQNEVLLSAVIHYMMGMASKEGNHSLRLQYEAIGKEIREHHRLPSLYYEGVRLAIHEFQEVIASNSLNELLSQMK